jgi:hypothetical protein
MGAYINPTTNFKALRKEPYIDKTGMISWLNSRINTKGNYVCVSRPCRFGKTMAAVMLAEYYKRGADSW